MATLYISEYPGYELNNLPVAIEPPLVEQTVAISGGSAQSAAFNTSTRLVRIHTDSICSILFGSNPTATATNKRLAANATEYFVVSPGYKVAVISNT